MENRELQITYSGEDSVTRELRIKGTNLGGNFNNDFEMYELIEQGRILLMTYKERWDERGYRVEVFSQGILRKEYIERMLCRFLPLLTLVTSAQLIINE